MGSIVFLQLQGCYALAVKDAVPTAVMREGRVFDACQQARNEGVQPGQTWQQSRLNCSSLVRVEYDPVFFQLLAHRYLDVLAPHARAVEPVAPHQIFLDLPPGGMLPREIEGLLEEIVPNWAVTATAGMASCKLLARALVNRPRTAPQSSIQVHALAPHEEKQFLHDLPITELWILTANTRQRLLELGMKRMGQLADLSSTELIRRFADEGKLLVATMQGKQVSPVQSLYPEATLVCRWSGEGSYLSLAGCLQAVAVLSRNLAEELESRGMAARQISLLLDHERSLPTLIHRERSRPYRTHQAMFSPLAAGLRNAQLDDAITGLQLIARALVAVPRRQAALLSPPAASLAEPSAGLDHTLLNLAQRYQGHLVEKGCRGKRDRREAMLRYYDPLRFHHNKGGEDDVQAD